MFNDNFFQGAVFLCFTKLVAAIHSLTDSVFISEQHLQQLLCIYNVFDRYFCLRCIVTSKEHLQPHVWVVPPLFQEATCKDLVFSRVLSFFERSNCNRLCFQRYRVHQSPVAAIHSTNGPFSIIKEQLQPQILSHLLYFFRTGGVLGMRKLKESPLFDDTNSSHSFLLWYCHCFMAALGAIYYIKGTVFILQYSLQASIIVSNLWFIGGNLKGTVFICGKQL